MPKIVLTTDTLKKTCLFVAVVAAATYKFLEDIEGSHKEITR